MEIGKDKFVTLKEDTHQYFDVNGEEYQSMSSLLGKIKPHFDRDGISFRKAKSNLPESATIDQIKAEQQRLLASWDEMRISSTDWGTWVHEQLESYFTIGSCDIRVMTAGQAIGQLLKNAVSFLPEVICYNTEYRMAGTFDLGVLRRKGNKGSTTLLDVYDFKTNERKGIELDSSYIDKHGVYQPGMKFLSEPLSHMEFCNFNIYALQLSLYAFMCQVRYGVMIGRLGILFVDKAMKVTLYPVPYLKFEAMQLFEFSREIKSLP